jgi:hypothetical protein
MKIANSSCTWLRRWPTKAVAAQRKRRHKKNGLHRIAARAAGMVDDRYFFFSSFHFFAGHSVQC